MPMTVLAWSFDSELGSRAMLKKLNELGLGAWEEGDSAYHDYLAGRLTKEGVVRIYAVGAHHVVNLRFFWKEGDAQAQLRAAKQVLLDQVLPALGARDVQPTEPFE
ncbi:MAG: hypothetical protein HY908_18445 [Myxococcales bacterium]|nr:hypothetical protein [Myxococcales bacterium]